ncbi:MAG TPA: sigma-70 family RNA polymerase sigma factor [Pirellulales bacterium]|nr:sigma-70 family RNA polymerase sigma factor [Pirellulales bacterium]
MHCTKDSRTRVSLLNRLRNAPTDPAAWKEFAACYSRKIYAWSRAWGLQDADALDVTQSVLSDLVKRLRRFHYNPNSCFRAWLKTLTRHAWLNYLNKQSRAGQGSGDEVVYNRILTIEARDDLQRRINDAVDEELLREAIARVRLRVEPRTWDAFYLLAIDGKSGAETAQQLSMKVGTVFVARFKVQRMLTQVVKELEQVHR